MATKLQDYIQLAGNAASQVTKNTENWADFLNTASRLYRYSFPDQLMIHAQRPKATACAEFNLWSVRMNRHIRRGSKGIGLVGFNRNGYPRIRYVFDIADTQRRKSSADLFQWQYKEEYREIVIKALEGRFGISGEKGLVYQLEMVAAGLVNGYWKNYHKDIMYECEGSFLEGLDEQTVSVKFRLASAASVSYALLSRCGFNPWQYLKSGDFKDIPDFNTQRIIRVLGAAVSESSERVLRTIAVTIYSHEHQRQAAQEVTKTAQTNRDKQPSKDSVKKPEEPKANTAQENDTEKQEPAASGTTDAEDMEQPKPDTAEPTIQENDIKEPEPAASGTTDTEPTASTEAEVIQDEADLQEMPAPCNFIITDDRLGEGGPKAKFGMNMEAITALKSVESKKRPATPDEQETLSKYVGWGGVPDAFEPGRAGWEKEYQELKEALTPEEYGSAKSSVLNAHYTSPAVIKAIYEAVSSLGFTSGRILEPACGIGNFFGLLPKEMSESKLYGVELDSVSGRIAKLLYPNAEIRVTGYEKTHFPEGFFDLAIGNVPFGQYQVNDPRYNRPGFSIHNYFIAKSLDMVHPGGILAFVTTRYTMDSKNEEVREYLAERADLLGAIRLPNSAFKANANTEVVSDILFLQRRESAADEAPEWMQTGTNADGFTVNNYFLSHPEMVLGKESSESTQYGRQDYTVMPIPGASLAEQLQEAASLIRGTYREAISEPGGGAPADILQADDSVKNYSFTLIDGEVYYRENMDMKKAELNQMAERRVKGMIELRDCVQKLISLQMDEHMSDSAIKAKQMELNQLYDAFTRKYGLINNRANRLAFDKDSSYYLLCSLEILDDDGNLERKADMFTKRTIKQHKAVTSVDAASEALVVSIGEKACVDLPLMSRLAGKTEAELIQELSGVIYKDPVNGEWQTSDEYLSGNVRRKLRQAQKAASEDPAYEVNVEALKAAQPKDLDASEIEVRLGATWIDKEYIQQFMHEVLNTPVHLQNKITVNYSKFTAEWCVTNKNSAPSNDVAAYTTYGTDRANAYRILEDSLNLRDVRIYDTVEDEDGKEKRVLNAKQTTLAQQKQQALKDAFKDWIFKDPERRQTLVHYYNETMNNTRPREYDGSHILFSGINPEIRLQPHQVNAIAHVLYGGNTLLAHEVGAGKTFEMIAAAMESKRLGLCHKSIFVVPNHLTEQTAAEFLRLYPAANILVTTKKDFETANRKKFCARIATSDIDAVIIGHSQFERIPISRERQERLLREQIGDITAGIREVKASNGERFTVKQLERTKKSLEARLEKLQANDRKDDVISFEELGVDMMFVDESDLYKNLFLYTKMRNVAGLSTADAQKSSDMFAKCRYLDETTGGRGIVFATGTPISNSMTEMYSIQRYLQYDRLQEMGMGQFDSWASRFGETITALDIACQL